MADSYLGIRIKETDDKDTVFRKLMAYGNKALKLKRDQKCGIKITQNQVCFYYAKDPNIKPIRIVGGQASLAFRILAARKGWSNEFYG